MPLTFARPVKPPYRVPTMEEVRAVEPNGLRFVSTFSGCGGSCLGFKMAGWTPIMASEFVPAAQESYLANQPDVPMMLDDIREVDPNVVLAYLGLEVGELDLLEGSPPCASFSTAGKRSAKWGQVNNYSDTKQRTDDLFYEYTRLLQGLQPRGFVAENVTGLTKGVAVGYFKEITDALKACGYRVRSQILDASRLGVPQARQRVIFMGIRNDLGLEPPDVAKLRYRPYQYTVRDAIPLAVRHGTAPPHSDWQAAGKDVLSTMVSSASEPAPTIVASGDNKGAGWVEVKLPVSVIHDRGSWHGQGDVTDRPCPTITVGVDSLNSIHYVVQETVVRVPVAVVHEVNGQHHSQGDVTDRPSPTIRAQAGASELRIAEYTVPRELWERELERARVEQRDAEIRIEEDDFKGWLNDSVVGKEWDKLEPGEQSERYFNAVKADPDEPSPTVTAAGGTRGTAGVMHPLERRKFTIKELKAICGFPPDFELTGGYRQQWERLGRAVPPLMMREVAAAMADTLKSV